MCLQRAQSFLHSNIQTHTPAVRDRSMATLKDDLLNEPIFRYGSFRELKRAKKINDLAKVLQRTKPEFKWVINGQKMWREIYYRRQKPLRDYHYHCHYHNHYLSHSHSHSNFHSHPHYHSPSHCDIVWGDKHNKNLMAKVPGGLQSKAAKVILYKAKRSSATEAVNELDWLFLTERQRQHRLSLVFKHVGDAYWNRGAY